MELLSSARPARLCKRHLEVDDQSVSKQGAAESRCLRVRESRAQSKRQLTSPDCAGRAEGMLVGETQSG